MNNSICHGCGQKNLPNAVTCSNCGLGVEDQANRSFGHHDEDPLKTIAVGGSEFEGVIPKPNNTESQNSSSKNGKSNSWIYWVVGGVAGLIVISGFVAIVIGIGAILYFNSNDVAERTDSNQKREQKDDSKVDELPNRGPVSSADPKTPMGRTLLKMIKSEYGSFGKFTLDGTEIKVLKTFDQAAETIVGNYKEAGETDRVIHSYSYYASWATAKRQATQQFRDFKRSDRRATLRSRRNSLLALFTVAGRRYYMECGKAGKLGLCQLVSSNDQKQLRRYIDVRYK